MIGDLTIDKSSMNISYFLATVCIINRNGGKITRQEFVKQMAGFMKVSPFDNSGREVRTPYNKSILPRYFGFVDRTEENGIEVLVLTHRGQKLVEMVGENPGANADNRYSINSKYREEFIDLIFDSVIFDSFGKNNCGAMTSNTDVEPPKVVFKTIQELGGATAEEICYIMYGLNRGVFPSFLKAIDAVRNDRSSFRNDYSGILDEWRLTNIVNDFKIANIFINDNIRLLVRDSQKVYNFSSSLGQQRLDQIKSIDAIYQPIRLFIYTDGNEETIREWIHDTIFGRVSDNSFVFRYQKGDKMIGSKEGGTFIPGIFEKALLKAFKYPKKNVYIIFNGVSESELPVILDKYYPLLKLIDDLPDSKHGWSESFIEDEDTYRFIKLGANADLEYNRVRIPSNLQMVGVIIMKDTTGNEKYDFEFKRALVKVSDMKPDRADDVENKAGGSNIIFYGVPGSGKSWTIEKKYNINDDNSERVVFHPDYTYADFIGQILPVIIETKSDEDNNEESEKNNKIAYKFNPGPFTRLLKRAYDKNNENKMFYLVIEEINRGNAPSIFGDVFQLLDRFDSMAPEKNPQGLPLGTSSYAISNADMAEEVFGDKNKKIRIPHNVTILATMNTSDQNVFTLDTAFQRRWKMRMIENDFETVDESLMIAETGISWKKFGSEVNKKIVEQNGKMASLEDKRLGTHFVTEAELNDREDFAYKVLKYLWDDAFKYDRSPVFNTEEYTSLDTIVKDFIDGNDKRNKEKLLNLFNADLKKVLSEPVVGSEKTDVEGLETKENEED